jgi:hypothetical protein
MDVPVAVLRDVGRNRAAQSRPGQTLVFVVEDVGPVPLQALGEIGVCLTFSEKRICLGIVTPNVSGNVVVDPADLILGHAST